ncbi:MAG: DUF4419 domain-containing protein [Myxococcales bacterium]|nr:DUF4419 domain-containing protein [Myxococcales bacterium]
MTFLKNDLHPLMGAVHLAFANHYPLVLSPDEIWLCIAQGFAAHVDLHAEELRGRFVRHTGKATIKVIRNEFSKGSPSNDWPGCFAEFSDQIATHVGKTRDLVVANFSTTGSVEKAASEVVLMAAMKHYFEYVVETRCGIPSITLLGTPTDWRAIRQRAATLSEYGLAWWIDVLMPILDEFVAASEGQPSTAHWQSFYKWHDLSGGARATGWINVLFPYLPTKDNEVGGGASSRGAVATRRNDQIDLWAKGATDAWSGLRPADLPSGLSVAPFTWEYLGAKYPMELVAGFVGVTQDAQNLSVRSAIGWAVRDEQPN